MPVLDAPVRGYGSDPARNLSQLRAADAPTGQAFTATEHAACPGHAAYIDTDEVWAQDPDDNTTDTDELPQGITAQPRYVCTDPSRYRHLNLLGRTADTGDPDPDDADAITRQAEADARAKETARVQRASLIRLNKDADTAETVRREFLRQSLTVKSRAKQMTGWALDRVIRRDPSTGDGPVTPGTDPPSWSRFWVRTRTGSPPLRRRPGTA